MIANRKARPPASASTEARMLLERASLPKSRAIGASMPPMRVPPTKSGATSLENSGLLHRLMRSSEAAMRPASMMRVTFSALQGAQGFIFARARKVENEREPREGCGEARGQKRGAHEQPVTRPDRDGGRGDQVPGVRADVDPDRQ